jgi:hypothetical protein
MSRENQRFLAIAIVIVVVVVVVFALSKKNRSVPLVSDPGNSKTENAPPPRPKVIENGPKLNQEISRSEFQTLIKKDKLEKEIGLQRMPLPREGNQALLKVVIAITPSCSPGDADAILLDLAKDSSHKLLATFEDLSENQKPLTWEVPQSLFKEGKAETLFKVPVLPDPTQYGFYLCTANGSDTTCKDKKIQDINEIFTEHLTKKSNAGQQLRNIFFQYFIVDERGLAALSKFSKGQKVFDKLKRYTEEAKIQNKSNRSDINWVKKTVETIDSLPAAFSKDKLVLQLPKFREAACR